MAQRAGADGSEHGARGANSRPPSAYGQRLPSGARGFAGCGERGTRWDARSQAHGAGGCRGMGDRGMFGDPGWGRGDAALQLTAGYCWLPIAAGRT